MFRAQWLVGAAVPATNLTNHRTALKIVSANERDLKIALANERAIIINLANEVEVKNYFDQYKKRKFIIRLLSSARF